MHRAGEHQQDSDQVGGPLHRAQAAGSGGGVQECGHADDPAGRAWAAASGCGRISGVRPWAYEGAGGRQRLRPRDEKGTDDGRLTGWKDGSGRVVFGDDPAEVAAAERSGKP
ncbi:hypothetical protein Asi03nite_16340 [Actinoplanes siamensis]|uniref:Uncharacterized protein n=1 Tax=Actinoplanes siamensis TaxID=1223317 RepID=A0A919N4B1_9ACTN|nr:hypothetical protein Asi03nite_16340 [Actinoplanes siamensis]